MNGLVDEFRRTLVGLKIRSMDEQDPIEVAV